MEKLIAFISGSQYYHAQITPNLLKVDMLTILNVDKGLFSTKVYFEVASYEGTCRFNLLKVYKSERYVVKVSKTTDNALNIPMEYFEFNGVRWCAIGPFVKSIDDLPVTQLEDAYLTAQKQIKELKKKSHSFLHAELFGAGFDLIKMEASRMYTRRNKIMNLCIELGTGQISQREFYKQKAALGEPEYIQNDIR